MILIGISAGSYPYGMARTIRNMTLLRGLHELNYDTSILLLYPDRNQDLNSNKISGEYLGVKYHYLQSSLKYDSIFFVRNLKITLSIFKVAKHLNKLSTSNKVYLFNFITQPFLFSLITFLINKKNIYIIHEVTEFPFSRVKKHLFFNWIYLKFMLPKVDRLFVINNALKEYFYPLINSSKIKIINMFVDAEPFSRTYKPVYDFDYIAYCGAMNTDKDGVDILIDAFDILKKKYNDIKLVLIGDHVKRPLTKKISKALARNNNKLDIIFTGHINNSELPRYLSNAKVLALSRPDNEKARGGFPTKLGEYLATKKPVVVSNVGEIPIFVKHKINGFLANPEPEDFADKLMFVLNNYQIAIEVGAKGYELVNNEFNYKKEVLKIDREIKIFSS